MKIILRDYKESVPVDVAKAYDAKALELEFVDLHYLEPLQMTGVVEKGLDTITFQGLLKSKVERLCGRCLKKVTERLEESFELYYQIADKEEVDATDDLREVLLLDHPLQYVCNETCKGLCPHCGNDRNEKDCGCESSVKNNVFSDLKKNLKNKKKP